MRRSVLALALGIGLVSGCPESRPSAQTQSPQGIATAEIVVSGMT